MRSYANQDGGKGRHKQSHLLKAVVTIFFIVVIIVCGIALFKNKDNISLAGAYNYIQSVWFGKGKGKGYPYDIADSTNTKISGQDDLVLLTDSNLIVLNKSAREKVKIQHGFNNPFVRSSGEYNILGNRGGSEYKVTSPSGNVFSGKMKNRIFSADIGKTGLYAVVTDSGSYLGEVHVFGKDNLEKYKWLSSEYMISGVAVNDNGRDFAITLVGTSGGSPCSKIYIFNIEQSEPIAKVDYDGTMLLHCEFLSNGNLVAMSNNMSTVVNYSSVGGVKHNEYDFGSQVLVSYSVDKQNGAAIALAPFKDNKNCVIHLIGKDGSLTGKIETSEVVKDISANSGEIVILKNRSVVDYGWDGQKKNEYDTEQQGKAIAKIGNNCYVAGIKSIEQIKLK